jgi:hypothetical protein
MSERDILRKVDGVGTLSAWKSRASTSTTCRRCFNVLFDIKWLLVQVVALLGGGDDGQITEDS